MEEESCKSMEEQMMQNQIKQKPLIVMQKALARRRALQPKPNDNISKNNELIVAKKDQKADEEVKLAALAISFNVRLRSADMPSAMQERALRHTRALLDSAAASHHRRPNPTLLARSLKKEFDSVYGPAWHCVAGKSFGSFVTHSPGGFVYFSVDSFYFLLFKTEVHLVPKVPHHNPTAYPLNG